MPAMLQLCLQKRLTHEVNCNETSRCPIFPLYEMVRQCLNLQTSRQVHTAYGLLCKSMNMAVEVIT